MLRTDPAGLNSWPQKIRLASTTACPAQNWSGWPQLLASKDPAGLNYYLPSSELIRLASTNCCLAPNWSGWPQLLPAAYLSVIAAFEDPFVVVQFVCYGGSIYLHAGCEDHQLIPLAHLDRDKKMSQCVQHTQRVACCWNCRFVAKGATLILLSCHTR